LKREAIMREPLNRVEALFDCADAASFDQSTGRTTSPPASDHDARLNRE
jgi:hypothetical protein